MAYFSVLVRINFSSVKVLPPLTSKIPILLVLDAVLSAPLPPAFRIYVLLSFDFMVIFLFTVIIDSLPAASDMSYVRFFVTSITVPSEAFCTLVRKSSQLVAAIAGL